MGAAMNDHHAFRAGWARGMRAVSTGDTSARWRVAIRRDHTHEYADGFCAALDHFDGGHVTHGTELGHRLGLVAAYADFYGQSDYKHPSVLPGHGAALKTEREATK